MAHLQLGMWKPFHSTRITLKGLVGFRKTIDSLHCRPLHTTGNPEREKIIISGISGRFPMSNNMEEFKTNLVNGVDMVSKQTRWDSELIPDRGGLLENLDKFDAAFFNIIPKQADAMDPQQRKLLEVVFEAIIDAGMNPTDLRGRRVGVYVANSGGETMDYSLINGPTDSFHKLSHITNHNFMLANRISNVFDFTGPSLALNTGCSAALAALQQGVNELRLGNCESAIVAASSVILNTSGTESLQDIGVLAPDGRSKTFDDSANGYARSEAVVAILLQKESSARRHYAAVRHVVCNSNGLNPAGIIHPSQESQEQLLRSAYEDIDPAEVTYIETHGTGTPTGDPIEVQAIYNAMCKDVERKHPLVLGSVKSNMGHCEMASGLASLAKVLIAIQNGVIPANLHFKEPNQAFKHLLGDKLEIANKPKAWTSGLVGINAFGIGGTNYHAIIEPGPTQAEPSTIELPLLIPFSGQDKEKIIKSLENASRVAQESPHTTRLMQEAFRKTIRGHNYRGFAIVEGHNDSPTVHVDPYEANETRPLWYIYPGMGSQWPCMAKDMMKLEPFAESIQFSSRSLKKVGIDLSELVLKVNDKIFNDIQYSTIAIAAVEIALHDVLNAIGLEPDGFIGHSLGEILCAYADGCLTQEEAILAADARGRSLKQGSSEPGAAASVNLPWDKLSQICPPGITRACHNSASNCTIVGPRQAVLNFVSNLESQGVIPVKVNSCNIAPHSTYISNAASFHMKYFKEICKHPRQRSSKWISSSVLESEWDSEMAKFCSAEYFTNNMTSPVLFHQAVQQIPDNAIVVEVSPAGFFKQLVQESRANCKFVTPMTSTEGGDKVVEFMESVGKLYNLGVDVEMSRLYPGVKFPLPATTPFIGSLVNWNHEQTWLNPVVTYPKRFGKQIMVDIKSNADAYLQGHKLGNTTLFPATGYLVLAWQGLAEMNGRKVENLPVTFDNVSFEGATVLSPKNPTKLKFSMLDQDGKFAVYDGDAIVVRGTVRKADNLAEFKPSEEDDFMFLNKSEVYKELRLRGYNYGGEFQSIQRIAIDGSQAEIQWTKNWTSFLDNVLQTLAFTLPHRTLAIPTRLQSVTIDPQQLLKYLNDQKNTADLKVPVVYNQFMNSTHGPGIEVQNLKMVVTPLIDQPKGQHVLKEHKFVPYNSSSLPSTKRDVICKALDVVIQSTGANTTVTELCSDAAESLVAHLVDGVEIETSIFPRVTLVTLRNSLSVELELPRIKVQARETPEDLTLALSPDLTVLSSISQLLNIHQSLNEGCFILLPHAMEKLGFYASHLKPIASFQADGKFYMLLQKKSALEKDLQVSHIAITSKDFNWVQKVQQELARRRSLNHRIYLTSQNDPNCGLLSLVKTLRKEPGGESIRGIFDPNGHIPLDFKNPCEILSEILSKDLPLNFIQNGILGTYCHVPYSKEMSMKVKEVEQAHVDILNVGDLSSLKWVQSEYNSHELPTPAMEIVRVVYGALNFHDIVLATGKLPVDARNENPQELVGIEFSGIDSKGQRVMGIVSSKSIATSVLAPTDMLYPFPESWTLEDAATAPCAYLTAYYALFNRGHLTPGQTVLIHSGTGGVGQAAIRIALAHKCQVFTTVGSEEKKNHIQNLFPQIHDDHIGNSRDCSFESQVMKLTNGRGVHLVLNSLTDDKLQASLRCVAKHGKFLELGSIDFFSNASLGMNFFMNNTEFHGIKLDQIYRSGTVEEKATLREHLMNGIQAGIVQPLPRTIFDRDQVEDAFRFMASGKHMGKVLVDVRPNYKNVGTVEAIGRTYFSPEKCYVVIGGLGGLGLETAEWMVQRGARHLVFPSRSGVTTGYQHLCMRRWQKKGVTVETPKVDLSEFTAAEDFVKNLSSTWTIGGVFNCAMVLKDGCFNDLKIEDFQSVAAPKITLTKNLDNLTRNYCRHLDFFVTFSSVSSAFGNEGQSNYAYANAAMERICENRRADGLHGLAIQWGLIKDVGHFESEYLKGNMDGGYKGIQPQSIASCMQTLDEALQSQAPVILSFIPGFGDGIQDVGKEKDLMGKVMEIFGIASVNKLNGSMKLSELGMDSLIAGELKNLFERELQVAMSPGQLRALTLDGLKTILNGALNKLQYK